MSTWTKAQWATAALRRLGIVSAGNAAPSAQQQLAESKADSLFPQLRRKGLAPFAVATIPEGAQDPLEALLAEKLASSFGVSAERRVIVAEEARQARKDLASYLASDPSPVPTEVDNY